MTDASINHVMTQNEVDATVSQRIDDLRFHERVLRAAVLAAGGEFNITHTQLGEASLCTTEIVDTDDGITVRIRR